MSILCGKVTGADGKEYEAWATFLTRSPFNGICWGMDQGSTAFPEEACLFGDITNKVVFLDSIKDLWKPAKIQCLHKLWQEVAFPKPEDAFRKWGSSKSTLRHFLRGDLGPSTDRGRDDYCELEMIQSAFAKHGAYVDPATAIIAFNDVEEGRCEYVLESEAWQAKPPTVIEGRVPSAFIRDLLSGWEIYGTKGTGRSGYSGSESSESESAVRRIEYIQEAEEAFRVANRSGKRVTKRRCGSRVEEEGGNDSDSSDDSSQYDCLPPVPAWPPENAKKLVRKAASSDGSAQKKRKA